MSRYYGGDTYDSTTDDYPLYGMWSASSWVGYYAANGMCTSTPEYGLTSRGNS
jgi:hypothetical protein